MAEPSRRGLAAKLRITAALLGCATRKELCARFRSVNPATEFDLERSYKWLQGRALPRSALPARAEAFRCILARSLTHRARTLLLESGPSACSIP